MIKLDYTVASKKVNNKIKKVWETQTWLNYENVDATDKEFLKSKFGGFIGKSGSIGFSTLKPNDSNNIKTANIINSYKYLESTGKYEMPPLQQMLEDLNSASNDIITKDDKENINKSTDEMWIKFMKDIQNPETQLLLKSFGQYSLADSTFGWKLAEANIMRIKAQKPDATFVQTRKQWHDKFKRRVLPNAKKIGVMIPLNHSSYQNQYDKANVMKRVGYKDNVTYDDLSRQQKDYIDVSSVEGEAKSFMLMAYYDVSDTVLIDPTGEDIWADTIGFDNNLTGHLNKAALNYKSANGGGSVEDVSKIYHNEEGDVKALSIALAEGIKTLYPDIPTSLPTQDNINAYKKCYSDMLEAISDRLIEEKAKIVKKENRQQGVLIATTIVMCLTRVAPETVALRLANNELTESSYFELRSIINGIIALMRRNMPKQEIKHHINEIELPMLDSVDELLSMMGMSRSDVKPTEDIGQQMESTENELNMIKENFFNIFNRINKQIL